MCYGTWLLGSLQRASQLNADPESSLGVLVVSLLDLSAIALQRLKELGDLPSGSLAFLLLWRALGRCGVLFLHAIPAGLCSCMGWVGASQNASRSSSSLLLYLQHLVMQT